MSKLYRIVKASAEEMNKHAREGYKYAGPGRKNTVVMEKEAPEVPTAREFTNGKLFIENFVANNDSLSDEAKTMLVELASKKRGPWSVRGHVTSVELLGGQIRVNHKCGYSNYSL